MKIAAYTSSIHIDLITPMANRLQNYMMALKSSGADVKIVMPSFEQTGSGIFRSISYSFEKIHINSKRFRIIKLNKAYTSIIQNVARENDIIFTSEDSITSISRQIRTVHNTGAKIVIELNENPYSVPGSRKDLRLLLKIKQKYFLNNILPEVDGIITISRALYDLALKHKGPTTEVIRIPILTPEKRIYRNLNYKGIPFILHAGSLSESKDGIQAMLQGFLLAHKKLDGKLKFIFTSQMGFPKLLTWIRKFIAENNLEKFIEFKGLIPKNELEKLYNTCSLVIVNKPSNPQNDYNFPTKLTEILPREIPLIITNTGELKYYFIDNENSFVVAPNDYNEIANKIIKIIMNPNNTLRITNNARIMAEREFYYENYSEKLFQFFTRVNEI
jgi:glycosyltransferase involved in cell wall biosynthesis